MQRSDGFHPLARAALRLARRGGADIWDACIARSFCKAAYKKRKNADRSAEFIDAFLFPRLPIFHFLNFVPATSPGKG